MERTIAVLVTVVTLSFGFTSQRPVVSLRGIHITCLTAEPFWAKPIKILLGDWFQALNSDENIGDFPTSSLSFEGIKQKKRSGVVVRTAARIYDKEGSKPSSPQYTTRKNSQPSVTILLEGIAGDYNHYRTQALSSTPDRAVSLLTMDVVHFLKAKYPTFTEGDLGENILIDGIGYRSMKVGDRYQVGDDVVLEITEPIQPCASLCKLPYINDPNLVPKDRITRCKAFIERLGTDDGLRGWYAKVLDAGSVAIGDAVQPFPAW